MSGCVSWQARQLVTPERIAWADAEGLDALLDSAEARGVLARGSVSVGAPSVAYRYLIFRPSTPEYDFEDESMDDEYSFSFDYRLGDPLDCNRPRTLLFLHGYGANAMQAFMWAPPLVERCWTVIAPDLRAHGGSGGDKVSFGVRERADLIDFLDALRGSEIQAGPVSVLGLSYGGTLALALNASGYPFQKTVAVAPFERGDRAARRAIERFRGNMSSGRINAILKRAAEIADIDWDDTAIDGRTTGDVHVVVSAGDRINPADAGCSLAARLEAACHRLDDPRWTHETLMIPSPDVLAVVLDVLTSDQPENSGP
ncbi:MAG: alpha/beta hydrolase [Wenzhouxiangella sp.]|nr:alpha/beta hydrolase [Wenzhouxiangella sp.]